MKKIVNYIWKSMLSLCLFTSVISSNVSAASSNTYVTSEFDEEHIQVSIVNYSSIRISPTFEELDYEFARYSLYDVEGDTTIRLGTEEIDFGGKKYDLSVYEDGDYYLQVELSKTENGTYTSYLTGYNGIHLEIDDGDVAFVDSIAYSYNEDAREDYSDSSAALEYFAEPSNTKLRTAANKIVSGSYGDYERALAIHDYIAEEIAVDYSATDYDDSNTDAYDVYYDGYGGSLGFANLAAELLRSVGISAMVIEGQVIDPSVDEFTRTMCRSKTINHAWVEFYDGDDNEWKMMDPYLDTTNYYKNNKFYNNGMKNRLFFDPSLEQFSNTHCIKAVEEFADNTIYVSDITLSSSTIVLDEDESAYIEATVYPVNAADKGLKYTSSDTSVVTVSSSGLLRAQGEGRATITIAATDGSGTSVKCYVEVGSSLVTRFDTNYDSLDLDKNENVYLTINPYPATAKDTSYTVTSSNTSVVRVTSAGLVTARAAGSATITITANDDGEVKKVIPVTVSSTAVKTSFVLIDESVYDATVGKTMRIGINYGSSYGTSSVSFKSSDTSVVTVNSSGLITPVAEGYAKITVTLDDGTDKSDSCFINVEKDTTSSGVTKVVLDATKFTMAVGDTDTIEATVTPSTSLSYVSTNTSVVTVTSKGVIEAVGSGTANIIVSANDGSGAYASATITVSGGNSLVKSIELGNDTALIEVGESYQINASVEPSTAKNKTLTYVSGNTSIATVNSSGLISAKAEGETTITIRSTDGSGISKSLKVTTTEDQVIYIEEITIENPVITLREGQSIKLNEEVSPSNATLDTLIYTSSDEDVVTISEKGKIYAEGTGEAVIKAMAQDGSGKYVTVAIEVIGKDEKILVSSIEIANEALDLSVGDTAKLNVTVYPDTAENKNLQYSSMNGSIATVTSTGLVTAVNAGTTYISVSALDGSKKQATLKVTVTKPQVEDKVNGNEIDFSPYSNMDMNVYQNSRVTSIKATSTGFVVDGYMFEQGKDCIYNDSRNWREIVFINVDKPSTGYAYRKQTTAVYNTWLNSNMTATVNGKYKLSYANYTVSVNPNSMNSYVGNVPGKKMAAGEYLVYMRISNGRNSYMFPLVDRTLDNGSNMENTGTLPTGFSVIDQTSRELLYTVY